MYFYDSRIRYSECDSEGRLTLDALLNYFQDTSTFQAEDSGIGMSYMNRMQIVWVLSYWQIVVDRYPDLGESIQTGTAPYEYKRFMGSRNFLMKTPQGEVLAKANSIWSLLDRRTGKPMLPSREMIARYQIEEKIPMVYAPRKVALPENGVCLEHFVVKKNNLDMNHHVNNGQFVTLAMNYLPEGFVIRQLRAEYKQQAFLGDVIKPYVVSGENVCTVALLDQTDKPYVVVEMERVC